ncbi:MAG: Ig-like domain-containing protein [Ruminococcus flavefaciens]|nr:Ig-like domain-containing protein [Ruminococcus flavefaciens]MCM1229347.1 Ig-like domain-containing protein [Ruminococcus flavefaciens]
MNCKKIITALMALCVIAGTPVAYSADYCNNTAYAENTVIIGELTLDKMHPTATSSITGIDTSALLWDSSDKSIATVDNSGNITAVGAGTCVVSAHYLPTDTYYYIYVTSTYEHLVIESVVNVGTISLSNAQPTAQATLSNVDMSSLVWRSSDKSVAVVDGEGNITAVGKGTCTVSAESNGTVYHITVVSDYEYQEPEITEVHIGDMTLTNQSFVQTIKFDVPDGTEIKYSSTDESVAVVSADGTVTAKGEGSCRIFAEIGNTRNYIDVVSTYTGESSDIINIGSISLTADNYMQTITISGIPQDSVIAWSSSDEDIAVISKGGVVSGIKKGTCIIYAETDGRKYALNVDVDFNLEDIMQTFEINGIGGTLSLSYSGMTDDVRFSSSDESVAVADEKGTVTAKGIGEAVIRAESSGGNLWVRVKVLNNVSFVLYGDANCDGSVDIADAAAIIQHLGNRDKYALDDQGLRNADVDGAEGITGMDALVIQQLKAGLIDSIPLSPQK